MIKQISENKSDQIQNKKGQIIDSVKFRKAFCNFCGTQRCPGIEDEEWREGCKIFQDYPNGVNES